MSQTLLGGFLSATFNPLAGDKPSTVEYLVVAGGGSGGGSGSNYPPGAGGGAGGYCEKIIASPTATYSYAVGSGGAGGASGSGGGTGGAGAGGVIIIEEHYSY